MSDNGDNGKIIRVAPSNSEYDPPKDINSITIPIIPLIGGFICLSVTIFIAAITATWVLGSNFNTINSNIAVLQEDVKNIKSDIADLKGDVEGISDDLYLNGGFENRLDNIDELLNISVVNIPDNESFAQIKTYFKQVSNPYVAAQMDFKSTLQIGYYENGDPCMAKDVINKPILLTYTEGTNEIYFYGEYNEKFHWNSYCVTNTYSSDGHLVAICESNFEDGKRLDYKSFYYNNDHEWIYSNKNCSKEGNIGTNITYKFKYINKKNFTNTNVRITDIIYVDNFIEKEKPLQIKYYVGNTSEHRYEDNSGNAYEIIYDEDGTIRTLYVGRFSNGTFNDDTGNAWDISYYIEGGFYVYNTGDFENGHAVKGSDIPIDINEITRILLENNFNCDFELNWKTK